MTSARAATILGITVPRFSGKTQEDVEVQLSAWKDGPLKKAWRAAAGLYHPDKNQADPDAESKFKEAQEAHEFMLSLRVRLRVPVKSCPRGHTRTPATAKFCHECGYAYDGDSLVETLRRAGILDRNITVLRESGELERIRAEGPEALPAQVKVLQQRQRLGLFGKHSGWGT